MKPNLLLIVALTLSAAVAIWGLVDNAGLTAFASEAVAIVFRSRAWFIMLTASVLLGVCVWLAFSRYAHIRLGADDDRPEFSTISWLTMLFAAGMGVGLLYFGAAEPLSHFLVIRDYENQYMAATQALFVTNFHWGLHAWAIYALTGLVIAYFSFRLGCPNLMSAPIERVFGGKVWAKALGWLSDLLAIYAIAIGVGGSIALGVFQVQSGAEALFDFEAEGLALPLGLFVVLFVCWMLPLTVDLGTGMARLSNTALAIAVSLAIFVLLAGPTFFMMNGIVEAIGVYLAQVIPHGFKTYAFFDENVEEWFGAWTLNYMVWWLAWAPFVGVFIARISRGRTIREYIIGVILVPTAFSIFWFGVFGSVGFHLGVENPAAMLDVLQNNIDGVTFFVLDRLPMSVLTTAATVIAAFLFIVTSVVSAGFVLGMFTTRGNPDPSVKVKLMWGVILGALGLVMILSNSMQAVRAVIALGAIPLVYIVLILVVCLLKALKREAV
jgi:glycine betaine transporter